VSLPKWDDLVAAVKLVGWIAGWVLGVLAFMLAGAIIGLVAWALYSAYRALT
jgi:hypothetical protein